mmetsp:Transcript_8377/g.17999  ORF Transcript_8377/g.17999 Transcript_8377/m.17999 type:complete len:279 (-) Transcript_8377:277-1113(-)
MSAPTTPSSFAFRDYQQCSASPSLHHNQYSACANPNPNPNTPPRRNQDSFYSFENTRSSCCSSAVGHVLHFSPSFAAPAFFHPLLPLPLKLPRPLPPRAPPTKKTRSSFPSQLPNSNHERPTGCCLSSPATSAPTAQTAGAFPCRLLFHVLMSSRLSAPSAVVLLRPFSNPPQNQNHMSMLLSCPLAAQHRVQSGATSTLRMSTAWRPRGLCLRWFGSRTCFGSVTMSPTRQTTRVYQHRILAMVLQCSKCMSPCVAPARSAPLQYPRTEARSAPRFP